MVKGDRAKLVALPVIGLVVLLALTACGSDDSASSVSLTDTKSPTQLLRNDAASRVPREALLDISTSGDASESCGLPAQDPKGLMRYWHSSIIMDVNSGFAADAEKIGSALVQSFVDEKWDATTQSGTGSSTAILQNTSGTNQEIRVTSTYDDNADGLGATITIDTFGPCVKTDGPDSDEVKSLTAD